MEPGTIQMSNNGEEPDLPLSPDSKEIMLHAQISAMSGDGRMMTEHLLASILEHPDDRTQSIFERAGVSVDEVRTAAERMGSTTIDDSDGVIGPVLDQRTKKALHLASREAILRGVSMVEPVDLILGLLRESQGGAAKILNNNHITLSTVRSIVGTPTRKSAPSSSAEARPVSQQPPRKKLDETLLKRLETVSLLSHNLEANDVKKVFALMGILGLATIGSFIVFIRLSTGVLHQLVIRSEVRFSAFQANDLVLVCTWSLIVVYVLVLVSLRIMERASSRRVQSGSCNPVAIPIESVQPLLADIRQRRFARRMLWALAIALTIAALLSRNWPVPHMWIAITWFVMTVAIIVVVRRLHRAAVERAKPQGKIGFQQFGRFEGDYLKTVSTLCFILVLIDAFLLLLRITLYRWFGFLVPESWVANPEWNCPVTILVIATSWWILLRVHRRGSELAAPWLSESLNDDESNGYALYLRSFDEDGISLPARLRAGSVFDAVRLRPRIRIEEVLATQVAWVAPLLAISPPDTSHHPLGSARTCLFTNQDVADSIINQFIRDFGQAEFNAVFQEQGGRDALLHVDDFVADFGVPKYKGREGMGTNGSSASDADEWREIVYALADAANLIIIGATPNQSRNGLQYELDTVATFSESSLLLTIGPWGDDITARWNVFRTQVEKLPLFAPVLSVQNPSDLHVLAYDPIRGWRGFTAEERSDWSYAVCIQQALKWLEVFTDTTSTVGSTAGGQTEIDPYESVDTVATTVFGQHVGGTYRHIAHASKNLKAMFFLIPPIVSCAINIVALLLAIQVFGWAGISGTSVKVPIVVGLIQMLVDQAINWFVTGNRFIRGCATVTILGILCAVGAATGTLIVFTPWWSFAGIGIAEVVAAMIVDGIMYVSLAAVVQVRKKSMR